MSAIKDNMGKRALSPLSSTVILLIVSILIGVVVMQWGRSYVEQASAPEQAAVAKEPSMFEDLNERLAKGELTSEQYNKIKEVMLKS